MTARTVYKYPLITPQTTAPYLDLELPDPRPVFVGIDPAGVPCVWIELDLDRPEPVRRLRFHIIGTGLPVPDDVSHLGSFVSPPFVWHVYVNEILP